jgi:hypothetical protein
MIRILALLLALLPAAVMAQPSPGPGIPTPSGTLGGVGIYCWSGTAVVMCPSAPATQAVSGAVSTNPGARTLVPLDIAAVTTGGTAVTALAAGHRTAGGWLQNPPTATIPLCINEIGTASGTTSAGSTTCIAQGQVYLITPAAGAVSVISSDSAHPFSGIGLN